jgi:hypothetical protein
VTWRGLSGNDAALLWHWLDGLEGKPDELHTHVPVGTVPAPPAGWDDAAGRREIEALWPRRIDAVARFGADWWLVECKPQADHYCLGQILCYAFWWAAVPGAVALSRVVVLTDVADRDCLRAFFAYGVEVVEVGDIFGNVGRGRRVVTERALPWWEDDRSEALDYSPQP